MTTKIKSLPYPCRFPSCSLRYASKEARDNHETEEVFKFTDFISAVLRFVTLFAIRLEDDVKAREAARPAAKRASSPTNLPKATPKHRRNRA
jgi:hypothetical protein